MLVYERVCIIYSYAWSFMGILRNGVYSYRVRYNGLLVSLFLFCLEASLSSAIFSCLVSNSFTSLSHVINFQDI